MVLTDAVTILEGFAATTSIAKSIYEWLSKKADSNQVDPIIDAALAKLPVGASGDDIVGILKQHYEKESGDMHLSAGHDNGGDLNINSSSFKAGPGGSMFISGGNGGPNGKGGVTHISGSSFSGGDPK